MNLKGCGVGLEKENATSSSLCYAVHDLLFDSIEQGCPSITLSCFTLKVNVVKNSTTELGLNGVSDSIGSGPLCWWPQRG